MNCKTILFLFPLIVFFSSCKKDAPHYAISDTMKQFFIFQKGSYWIYNNDSTNVIDSTFIDKISYSKQGKDDDGRDLYSFDLALIDYNSQFLAEYQIGYLCIGPNTLVVLSNLNTGWIAFYQGWKQNIKISSNCIVGSTYLCTTIPSKTINDNTYKNILYTKVLSNDSSSTNQYFYSREIYFAKNIGIIKYIEEYRFNNTQRSWSLKRFNAIQ